MTLFAQQKAEEKWAEMSPDLAKSLLFFFSSGPLAMAMLDRDFQFIKANNRLCEVLGYAEQELMELSLYDLTHPRDIRLVLNHAHQVFQSSNCFITTENRCLKKNKEICWLRFNSCLLQTDNDSVLMVIEDNTSLQKQIQDTRIKESILNKIAMTDKLVTLGHYTTAIAHKINNPLDIILTKVYLLQTSLPKAISDPLISKSLEEVKNQIVRLSEFTKSILNYAKPQSLHIETLDINSLIQNSIESLSDNMDEHITITTDFLPDLMSFQGDGVSLEIAFKNILLNSVEAMPAEGHIHICTSMLSEEFIKVTIEDNGIGIPEEDIKNIFEPLYSRKPPYEGTGLGLSITKKIIKDHHGEMEIKSIFKKGTSVILYLPILHHDK